MSKRWADKSVIGVTGNIATGKSVVRRMLEHLGAFGIDADGLVHRAMSPGAPAYKPTVEMFGKWILTPDGQVSRERLGGIVFHDEYALQKLEEITHPIVEQVVDLLIKRSKKDVVVIEAIKLIEAGFADDVDAVWVVDAPAEVQLKRLMKDRKMSEEEARTRMGAQSPQSEKLARADLVINNGGNHEDTYNQIQAALAKLTGEEVEEVEVTTQSAAEAAVKPEPVTAPVDAEVTVHRGGPKQAEAIAAFINREQGQSLTRTDVMHRFGQKAYMMAVADQKVVALAGWKVENLIARIDEYMLLPGMPAEKVVGKLMTNIEKAADDLQCEIVLLFLPKNIDDTIKKAVTGTGYEIKQPTDLRVPDWREAAEESAPPDTVMAFKRIREDRVLKPI